MGGCAQRGRGTGLLKYFIRLQGEGRRVDSSAAGATAAAGPNISNLCSAGSSRTPPALAAQPRPEETCGCARTPRRVGGSCGSASHRAPGSHLYAPPTAPSFSLGTAFFTLSVFSHSLGKSIQWGRGGLVHTLICIKGASRPWDDPPEGK